VREKSKEFSHKFDLSIKYSLFCDHKSKI